MNTLGNLPIGASFADKKCYCAIWRVAGRHLPGYPGTIIVRDRYIEHLCFDAKEPRNPDENRAKYGNNHYSKSCVRQYLNADGSNWFQAKHEYDEPPYTENVYGSSYARNLGYLTNFSQSFKDALCKAEIKTLNTATSKVETVHDSVWLLSKTEIGIEDDYQEGEFFPYFADHRARGAHPRQEYYNRCDSETEYLYFLRSPYKNTSYEVHTISEDGDLGRHYAYFGLAGIRPAVLLKSETPVSDKPDGYGVYYVG